MKRPLKKPSKTQKPYPIHDKRLKELASLHLIKLHKKKLFFGPFAPDQIPDDAYVSAVFLRDKDPTRNKILFLVNFSAPKNNSINSEIKKEDSYVWLPSVKHFVSLATFVGPHASMYVIDLDNAYYNVFINKHFRKLFGIHFDGKVIFPLFMPFGVATGCITLQTIMDVVYVALFKLFPTIYTYKNKELGAHYLDDAIFFSPSTDRAWWGAIIYIIIFSIVGLPISPKKVQWPTSCANALGFQFNLKKQSLSLIEKKVNLYLIDIRFLLNNPTKATIKKLQIVCGRLRYASNAIHGSQAFVRQLEEQFHALLNKNFPMKKFFTLTQGSLHNLRFWDLALPKLNTIPFSYINFEKSQITKFLFTDASGSKTKGCGAWDTEGNWFSLPWSKTKFYNSSLVKNNENNELEFLTVAVSFLYFINSYKNQPLGILCDNQVAVSWMIKKAPSFTNKYQKFISYLIRKIQLTCLKNNIFIWIDYITTKENKRADALSRLSKNALSFQQPHYINPSFKKMSNLRSFVNNLYKKFCVYCPNNL